MNQPLPSASVAQDVRKLIKQVEGGNAFDTEFTGHAFDVQEQAIEAVRARLGVNDLGDDVAARLERFARDCASAQLYLRLVITDEMPQLVDYDPCHVSVYDGIQEAGTDFSKVIQRSTIYGTVMTSVNMTDLRAYFESGRKRHLLLYLGSDRNADMKALDKMLAALPAILAAAGMDAATIKQVIAAIKTGNVPPAVMKMITVAIKMADLKAMPSTPQTKAQIIQLQKDFVATAARAAAITATLAPAFAKMVAALKIAVSDGPRVVQQTALNISTPIRADNDNRIVTKVEPAKAASVKPAEAASLAVPAQKSPGFVAAVFPPVQAVLRQTLGFVPAAVARVVTPILDKIIPSRTPVVESVKAEIKTVTTPVRVIAEKAVQAVVVEQREAVHPFVTQQTPLPVATAQSVTSVIERAATASAIPVIVATAKAETIAEAKQAVAKETVQQPQQAEQKTVELKTSEKPAEQKTKTSTGPCGEFCRCAQKGEIVVKDDAGKPVTYTQVEVKKNDDAHAAITAAIEAKQPKTDTATVDKWNNDLAQTFAHKCGPGCNHDAPKVSGEISVANNITVNLTTIEPVQPKNAPAGIRARSRGPA